MADAIRQNQEMRGGIERLAGTEQFAREFRPDEIAAAAGGAVHYEDRIGDDIVGVALWLPEGAVMDAEFRKGLAGLKMKIANGEIAGFGRRVIGGPRNEGGG